MTEPKAQPVTAALWMMGAVVSFTTMAVAGRAVAHELDTFEIMAYRSLLGIVLVVVVARLAGTLAQISTGQFGLHLVRNIFHFAGQNLWFYALTLVTLPQLFAFEFSVPIWVALVAPFFLAERLTRARLLAALVGFCGILIVARPGAMGLSPGMIAAALSAIGFTGAAIATKRLTRRQSTTSILFWLTVMQAVLGIAFMSHDGDIAVPSGATIPWIGVIGIAGLFAHFCITSALRLAPAIVVFPMDFVRLPLAAAIGLLLYDEPLDALVFVGAAIILAANFMNIRTEYRQSASARGRARETRTDISV